MTGASKGIGAACALLFGKLGGNVAVHYHLDRPGAEDVAKEIRDGGGQAEAIAANLSVWGEGELLVSGAEARLGPIDVVVINHGIWKGAPIDAMTGADYDEMIDANVRGAFSVTGAITRRMKPRKKGRIILIASTAGQRGEADHSHYAASKGALISLTKSLASELAGDGILVNCVAPGWVDTTMSAPALSQPLSRKAALASIPLGRVATPAEIAGPVVFLASEHASFITGEILNVNGGAVLVG
ncbi:MAG: SDR family oxidoreductase [Polyangiaceae bacterium]